MGEDCHDGTHQGGVHDNGLQVCEVYVGGGGGSCMYVCVRVWMCVCVWHGLRAWHAVVVV
jgi:hypothetical protein